MPNPKLRSFVTPCVDSIERWELFNPVIPYGVMCIAIMGDGQSPKAKVGDGKQRFTDLPWSSTDPDSQKDLVANGIAFVCESWRATDGSAWYRKYSDGWVEQGGVYGGPNFTAITVNFPIPFAEVPYHVNIHAISRTANYADSATGTVRGYYQCAGVLRELTPTYLVGPSFSTVQSGYYQFWHASGYAAL